MTTATATPGTGHSVKNGTIAGLGGGIVFGMMMAMMGSLEMIAGMVGSTSVIVGFGIHMMISAFIGAGFGLVVSRFSAGYGFHTVAGMIYGIFWWVLGPLVMMPIMMGMTEMVFQVGSMQMMSLMGHVIFGVITGLIYTKLTHPV